MKGKIDVYQWYRHTTNTIKHTPSLLGSHTINTTHPLTISDKPCHKCTGYLQQSGQEPFKPEPELARHADNMHTPLAPPPLCNFQTPCSLAFAWTSGARERVPCRLFFKCKTLWMKAGCGTIPLETPLFPFAPFSHATTLSCPSQRVQNAVSTRKFTSAAPSFTWAPFGHCAYLSVSNASSALLFTWRMGEECASIITNRMVPWEGRYRWLMY